MDHQIERVVAQTSPEEIDDDTGGGGHQIERVVAQRLRLER